MDVQSLQILITFGDVLENQDCGFPFIGFFPANCEGEEGFFWHQCQRINLINCWNVNMIISMSGVLIWSFFVCNLILKWKTYIAGTLKLRRRGGVLC